MRSWRWRPRQVSVAQAAPETLRQLDQVLSIDARVYRAAVLRVLCDLRALERATGMRRADPNLFVCCVCVFVFSRIR